MLGVPGLTCSVFEEKKVKAERNAARQFSSTDVIPPHHHPLKNTAFLPRIPHTALCMTSNLVCAE